VTACLVLLVYHFCLAGESHLVNSKRMEFEHFTIEDGLPQNTVFTICQDSRGFLWLGTEDGVCRYDGYTFKPYQYDPENSSSLSNNRIFFIFEDRSEKLWIGTESGLNRFDRFSEHFTRFEHDPLRPKETLCNNTVISILEDHRGILWVGTDNGGVHSFNSKNQTFTCYKPDSPHVESGSQITSPLKIEGVAPSDYSFSRNTQTSKEKYRGKNKVSEGSNTEGLKITVLFEDSSKLIWVGTSNGLYTFEYDKKTFSKVKLPDDNSSSLYGSEITAIYEDRSHVLWIGSKSGRLLRLNRENKQFIPYVYDPSLFSNEGDCQVLSIFEDRAGEFWLGVYNAGLYRLDRRTRTSEIYKEHPWISESISSNHIFSIYQDRGGIIWIGTEDGLNKLDKRKNEFVHWTTEPGNRNSLSDNNVWAITKDKSGILWIGTDKGLNRLDRNTGNFKHYNYDPDDPQSLSNDRVMVILEESPTILWIGTQGGGLNRLDLKTERFTRFTPHPGIPGSLSHDRVMSLHIDRFNNLWVGTQEGGLNRFHRGSQTFTHYKSQKDKNWSLSNNSVLCINEDKEGKLWIGTDGGGLNLFHYKTATFTSFQNDPNNADSLSSDKVSSILEDSMGNLWIGTYEGGLNQLIDPDKGTFHHYRKINGLPNDTIFGILEDKQGNLWISTVNGLAKFNPLTKKIKNYFALDGLQSNEFNGGAYFRAEDGEMFFGGMNGFNTFYPVRIIGNPYPPAMVITNFLVFNKPYLNTSITETEKVILSYDQDVFSIEFAALDFSIPEKNRYEHRMEEVDPDWVSGNAKQRTVNYTKLSPGKYEFRVRGTNNDNVMSREGATLTIIIKPPFWQTIWFRILLGILFLLLILAFHLMRTRRLRRKIIEQERIQKILKESHDEMERARDLAEFRHAENEKILSSISSIFIAVDANGIIFQWNKTAEDFFSLPIKEVEKKIFIKVLEKYIYSNVLHEIIEKGLKQDGFSQVLELNVDLKSIGKGIRVLNANISPIRDSSGRHLGFLFLAEDITNRREEEILGNLSRKLESLGQMASSIAHEIKTPLQYIGHNAAFVSDSFTEVAKFYKMINDSIIQQEVSVGDEISEKIEDFINKYDLEYIMTEIPTAAGQIIGGVNRVSKIIQAMNEFSHPGRGFKEKADINLLLQTTLVMVQSKIKKNADIHLELSEELPPIHCFASELNQVFINLLINAADAIIETGKWGVIGISTSVEDDEILITISDTGCGIPEENKDNIFTPFFTTKEIGKGTGQGLSLAHNVIFEKHKGKLSFSSQLGKGTTFYIRLPIKGEK